MARTPLTPLGAIAVAAALLAACGGGGASGASTTGSTSSIAATVTPWPAGYVPGASPSAVASVAASAEASPSPHAGVSNAPGSSPSATASATPPAAPSPMPSPTASSVPITIPIPGSPTPDPAPIELAAPVFPNGNGTGSCATSIGLTGIGTIADVRISQTGYSGAFITTNTNTSAASAAIDPSTEILSIEETGAGLTSITVTNSYGTTASCSVTTN